MITLSSIWAAIWGPYANRMFGAACLMVALDQAFKLWMLVGLDLDPADRIQLTPFLDIVMVWNHGISYGLFQQAENWGRLALIAMSSITVLVIWIWANTQHSHRFSFGASLVIGGGIGNLIDRLFHGAVADFFSFHAFGFYWYVFNIADVAITIGFIIMFYDLMWPQKSAFMRDK